MIKLCVEPGTIPMSWREFIRTRGSFSIALDGYVRTGPRFSRLGPHANFNHHEGVSRLETRATCAQVLLAVRQGLFDCFINETGNPFVTIFVNDCDEDVSTSVFILKNHNLALGTMNPSLNRLVSIEDMMDTTAGAYPFPKDLETLQQLMWIFAPYHHFRISGGLDKRDSKEFESIIDDVGLRIMAHITGSGKSIELNTSFERIGGGKGWVMIKETGPNARIGVYAAGIRAFVSVRERGDGNFAYTFGRSSQFINFPLPKFVKAFNFAEGLKIGGDCWGGGDNTIGSPRNSGSKLKPDVLTEMINALIPPVVL